MTRIKICGITSPEDAELAVEHGVFAIGLIFHPGSPRSCDLDIAERIGVEFKRRTEIVGVFVNETLEQVTYVADRCELSLLQLHGDEGPAYCIEAARRTGARVMKVARVRDRSQIRALAAYAVDFHMLDTYRPDHYGGTGERFPWALIPHGRKTPLVLSGGLDPDNVAEAIRVVRPFAVDSASGTESEPGVKDPAKVTAFVRAIAHVDHELVAAAV